MDFEGCHLDFEDSHLDVEDSHLDFEGSRLDFEGSHLDFEELIDLIYRLIGLSLLGQFKQRLPSYFTSMIVRGGSPTCRPIMYVFRCWEAVPTARNS